MEQKLYFSEHVKVSEHRGIYFLLNDDEIVYVGQSENIYKRIGSHLQTKDFNSWNFIEVKEADLSELEAFYILTLKPFYNRSVPTNNKWLSQNMARDEFGLGKHFTNKMIICKKLKSIEFNGMKYFELDELLELTDGN